MNYLKNILKRIVNFLRPHTGSTVRPMFPLVFGMLAFLGAAVVGSESSYVKLVPSATTVLAGERFSIDIYANAHVPVNALDLTISYLPEAVEVLSVDKAQSVLTIWTKEPVISENNISLSGGTYRRGFIGEHLVATIKVEAKFSGNTEFLVSRAELLAGDGLGTPVKVSGTGDASKQTFYILDENDDPTKITANLGLNITADIDGDGKVTLKDVSSFMAAWSNADKTYDFNKDGRMNFVDFSIILAKSFF
jgi:hypothetical protein